MNTNDQQRKLFLVFHGRFPGEKAAAVFTGKNAEAFAEVGLLVTVLAPRRLSRSRETPAHYFGVKENFRTVYLPILDFFSVPILKWFAFPVSYITFSISTFFYLVFCAGIDDYIYSNEAPPLLLVSFFFPHTFYEVHDFPREWWLNRMLFSRVKGIVVTNRWKRDEIARQFDLPSSKLLYEPNAVDVEEFSRATGGAIRKKLAVPTGSILICYSGALRTMGMEKGIDTLLDALALLPPRFRLLVVGGSADDVSVYRNRARQLHVSDRVFFTGWLRHQEVREYLAASDILVAPFPKTPHYDLYMSPMKLFEYMAVGKPIVASRLRSICEIVDERSAFLVTPGDVTALSHGIAVASSDDSAGERVQRAYETVREHGWHKRATRLLRFLLDAQ